MKVLHTVPSLRASTGGPARSVPGLAGALAAQGVEVTLWSREADDGFITPSGVDLRVSPWEEMQKHVGRFDLIHDHGLWLPMNHWIAVASRATGIPRVVSPRGMLEPWAMRHRKWKKRIAWWLYQRRDLQDAVALHATAEAEAEQFRRLGLKRPIFVVPNGVEVEKCRKQRTESGNGRTESVNAEGKRTALFLSRVHPKKGLPMLVEAWARVRPTGWRMRVVGPDEGGHLGELKELVASAGLAAEWSFEGALDGDAKAEAFETADLFVLPTHSENFGIAVAEALAHGLPVITTTGAPWEGLASHRCGWWVEPNAGALAEALRQATLMPMMDLRAMGEAGLSWMDAAFSWSGIAERMKVSYHRVLWGRNGD